MEFGFNALVLINEANLYDEPVSTGMGDRVRVRFPGAALYFGM